MNKQEDPCLARLHAVFLKVILPRVQLHARIYFRHVKPILPTPSRTKELSPRERQEMWKNLAAPEPPRPWEVMRSLMATPQQSVPLLQTMLQPIASPDRSRVARLLAVLDSEVFEKRRQASDALLQLGELVEPYLRKTLEENPTLELRRRVLMLLEQIERQATSPQALRILRVTAILERINDDESRALLQRLAGGAAGARLTREAAASVHRLTHRNSRP
ncbi:MAG: hypothetical protein ACYC3I_25125 [Gemmataceae bacterium]